MTVTPPLADGHSFSRSLGQALKMDFAVETDGPDRTVLRRRERLRPETITLSSKKERVSGDCCVTLRTPDGRFAVLMSDGMGTGREAGELSRGALRLITNFMRAGASSSAAAGAVLPLLSARFSSRGFVTLDLFELDPFTGVGEILKMGAPLSYLVRRGSVRELGCRTLPAGAELKVPPGESVRLQRATFLS